MENNGNMLCPSSMSNQAFALFVPSHFAIYRQVKGENKIGETWAFYGPDQLMLDDPSCWGWHIPTDWGFWEFLGWGLATN